MFMEHTFRKLNETIIITMQNQTVSMTWCPIVIYQSSAKFVPGSEIIEVTYEANVRQIIVLVMTSFHCSQRIRWRCRNAPIYDSDTGEAISYWVSGETSFPFGEGVDSPGGCECSKNGSCALGKCIASSLVCIRINSFLSLKRKIRSRKLC